MALALRHPGRTGKVGAVRFSAWTWVFSSTQSTSAASGGFRQRPTTSRTLSTNCGPLESLKVSARWGFRPKARQILEIADWLIPICFAIERVDQCVASPDSSSSVFTITASTMSSVIVRTAPGGGRRRDRPSAAR